MSSGRRAVGAAGEGSSVVMVSALVAYAVAVNAMAFALFGIDKRRAAAGAWRIRESTLIGAALIGGWPGAKAGQRRFRHKTRKQPFARRLNAVPILQAGILALAAAAALSPPVDLRGVAGRLAQRIDQAPAGIVAAGPTPEERPRPRRFGPGSEDW